MRRKPTSLLVSGLAIVASLVAAGLILGWFTGSVVETEVTPLPPSQAANDTRAERALLIVRDDGACVEGWLHADGTFEIDGRKRAFNLSERYPWKLPGIAIVTRSQVKKVTRRNAKPEPVRYRLQGSLFADGILDEDGTLTVKRTMTLRHGGSGHRVAWPSEVKRVVWPEGVAKPALPRAKDHHPLTRWAGPTRSVPRSAEKRNGDQRPGLEPRAG